MNEPKSLSRLGQTQKLHLPWTYLTQCSSLPGLWSKSGVSCQQCDGDVLYGFIAVCREKKKMKLGGRYIQVQSSFGTKIGCPLVALDRWLLYTGNLYSKTRRGYFRVVIIDSWSLYKGGRQGRSDSILRCLFFQ